ncbi:MAG: DUF1428 domain-containing protein [Polyangiaceae bacterium]
MSYIDGFVIPVPAANKDKYRQVSVDFARIAMEYGALQVVECWGDDIPDGKVTDFKRSVKAEDGEVVVLSWTVWPSKKVRHEATTKMRDDPRMKEMEPSMPFDGKRLIQGGFEVLTDSKEAKR